MPRDFLKHSVCSVLPATAAVLALAACGRPDAKAHDDLVGAWRAQVQFTSGAFAAVKDLEFMYVFNEGGTMTESSNYDAAPPVPPAYGVWRRTGSDEFEARYEFYVTRPPATADEILSSGGWLPAGRGVFTERITMAPDGKTFRSEMRYEALDSAGQPAEGSGEATVSGVRVTF